MSKVMVVNERPYDFLFVIIVTIIYMYVLNVKPINILLHLRKQILQKVYVSACTLGKTFKYTDDTFPDMSLTVCRNYTKFSTSKD